MKIYALSLLASLGALNTAAAVTFTPGGQQFFGNANVTGSGVCVSVAGVFPAEASFTNNSDGTRTYALKILIQNSAQGLPLQYIEDVISPNGTFVAYDPQLLGTVNGVPGTQNDKISAGFALGLGDNSGPLILVAPIAGTNQTCTLALTGTLYFSTE